MYNVPQILTILTLWSVESRFLEEAEEVFKDYFSGLPYIPVEPQKFQCNIYVGNRYVIIPNKYINKSLSNLVGFSEDIEILKSIQSVAIKILEEDPKLEDEKNITLKKQVDNKFGNRIEI